ncbi:hypothetical protein [Bacillus sp. FJAT-18017]|uniref:hypothetical protein n=1 Tax=Bacillus sp. FJAT-18017 TaxID=1705566 RepID=UPI000A3F98BF|nr:hypothetical protein [Bacillus sp. FJAT-18017]
MLFKRFVTENGVYGGMGTDTSLGYGSAMNKPRWLLVFTKVIVVFFEVGMGMI